MKYSLTNSCPVNWECNILISRSINWRLIIINYFWIKSKSISTWHWRYHCCKIFIWILSNFVSVNQTYCCTWCSFCNMNIWCLNLWIVMVIITFSYNIYSCFTNSSSRNWICLPINIIWRILNSSSSNITYSNTMWFTIISSIICSYSWVLNISFSNITCNFFITTCIIRPDIVFI